MAFTGIDAAALGIIVEGIFYGAYAVLFILYMVLRCRDHRMVDEPLTVAQILLFVLCTVSICLDIPTEYFLVVPDVANKDTFNKFRMGSMVMFALIDFLAQMILLYRCWIVWDKRWAFAIPGFLVFVTLGGGFAILGLDLSPLQRTDREKFTRLYSSIGIMAYSISLAVNALTTSLLVAKILLTTREVRIVHPTGLVSSSHQSLRMVTAMLIESGFLMFTFQLVLVVLFAAQHPAADILCGPITQIYGIAPTLLGLRVAMGSTYNETMEKTGSLEFAHSQSGAATQATGPSTIAAGVHSQVIDIELDVVSGNQQATEKNV